MRVEVKKDPEGPDITVEIHCRDITDEVSRLERHIKRFKAYIPAAENGEMLNVRLDAILYIESLDKVYERDQIIIGGTQRLLT